MLGSTISGLMAANKGIDVTSNNISYGSTVGFKQSMVSFVDIFINQKKFYVIKYYIILLVSFLMFNLSNANAQAVRYGNWSRDCRQGYCEYYAKNGNNYLGLTCDVSGQYPGDFEFNVVMEGKKPSPNSWVSFIIGGYNYQLYVDKKGSISTRVHVYVDEIRNFLDNLRYADSIYIIFPNGGGFGVNTKGGQQILPSLAQCPGGYYVRALPY